MQTASGDAFHVHYRSRNRYCVVRPFSGEGDFLWVLFTVYRIYRPAARRPHKRKRDAGAGARGTLDERERMQMGRAVRGQVLQVCNGAFL